MRPDGVIMAPPPFDQHLCFVECRKDLSIEQLVAQLGIEALIISVLPWAARLDIERLDADPLEPAADGFGNELRTVVRPDMLRRTVYGEQIRQARERLS